MSNSYRGPREWKVRSELASESAELEQVLSELEQKTGLSRVTLRVCLLRGLDSPDAIQRFLNPTLDQLKAPACMRDMDRAMDRMAQVKRNGDRIRVFGDYDVDGTTGAALLSWVFRDYGFEFDVRQPDRFKDGYGLNVKAVEEAAAAGVKLLITVDCGITSFDAANKAKELGVDLIVLDHHQVDPVKGIPEAVAVVNPQRMDCESGLRQLCGCGIAFYFAVALRQRWRLEGWFERGPDGKFKEPNLKQHLDLVVMAVAADMVPLTGDNHVLVRHGLEVLKKSQKPGVQALLDAAGLGMKDISPGHLGFVIGPRINASGRMVSAALALELLTTTDRVKATVMAHELESLNKERAEIQNRIWDEVRVRVETGIAEGKYQHGIVVADPGWHEGVVGIVASRVTETFRRPAAVIALREDFGKGSVRSWGGKDVLGALRASAKFLLGFGGHKHAAGLSVAFENVEAFTEAFDRALGEMPEDADSKPLLIDGDCTLEQLDLRTIEELERLGPFGPGNPEPIFSIRASIRTRQVLKGRHLKLNLGPVSATPAGPAVPVSARVATIEAIWFHGAEDERMSGSESGAEIPGDWAAVPELNRFRGKVTPTLRVRDFRRLT